MVVVTRTNSRVGRRLGIVTFQNRSHELAPSSAAASCSCQGTDCRPARKMIMPVPKLRHTTMAISDGSAVCSSPSQFGPVIPTQPRTVLTSPLSGLSRKRQITATATMLVTTGV